MSEFLSSALGYASAGWQTFPCLQNGKTPLTQYGFKDASSEKTVLEEWDRVFPGANLAVATGQSNLVVLDVDPKSGGMESLRELVEKHPDLKQTYIVKTGSGGYHFYFRARPDFPLTNSASKVGPGLDIRANGGYVIAPPSIHANGNPYTWERSPKTRTKLAEVPMWLIELIYDKQLQSSVRGVGDPDEPIHERHATLASIAGMLRHKGLDEDSIFAAIQTINVKRCQPGPLEENEVRRIARNIGNKPTTNAIRDQQPREGKKRLDLVRYDSVKKEDIDWLWYGRVAYGKLALLVGLPGKTKSYLTCKIAAHVSTGKSLPDDHLQLGCTPQSVLFVTYEDGYGDTIRPRLEKCGADLTKIYTLPLHDNCFTVDDIPALEQTLKDNPDIRLVIIDPMQNMMGGVDDHSDSKVRVALNPLIIMATKLKVAVLGIKHLNKNENQSIDSRIGGSIGYAGMARTVLFAGHDNEKPFGPQREVYAGVMVTKGNLAGSMSPLAYEVNDRGLIFHGPDLTLTPERLLPLPPSRKKKDAI